MIPNNALNNFIFCTDCGESKKDYSKKCSCGSKETLILSGETLEQALHFYHTRRQVLFNAMERLNRLLEQNNSNQIRG